MSRLQFLADRCNVDLSKPIFESGLTIEEDFQVARVFQIADQGGVGDHTLEPAANRVAPHPAASTTSPIAKESLYEVVGSLRLKGVEPEDILSAVDPGAYLTGFYAPFRRHLVTQVPTEVTCFTDRHHNRKSDRITPAGKLRFICVPPSVYARPEEQVIAPAEQALCDFAWLNLRDEIDPQSLVTFQKLDTLSRRRLHKALRRYPEKVRTTAARIIGTAAGTDDRFQG